MKILAARAHLYTTNKMKTCIQFVGNIWTFLSDTPLASFWLWAQVSCWTAGGACGGWCSVVWSFFFFAQTVAGPLHIIVYSGPAKNGLHPLWPSPLVTINRKIHQRVEHILYVWKSKGHATTCLGSQCMHLSGPYYWCLAQGGAHTDKQ